MKLIWQKLIYYLPHALSFIPTSEINLKLFFGVAQIVDDQLQGGKNQFIVYTRLSYYAILTLRWEYDLSGLNLKPTFLPEGITKYISLLPPSHVINIPGLHQQNR